MFYTPSIWSEEGKVKSSCERAAKRVYLRVACVSFCSSGSGFLWCALFSHNIIIPPHGKPSALVYVHSIQHSNLYPIFPSSSFLLMFLSLLQFLLFLFPFCCCSTSFWFCSFFLFCSLLFFSGRNHSPIFILSSFVCEQRPQKVALGLSLAGV